MSEQKKNGRPVVANLQYGGAYQKSLEEAAKSGECIFCKSKFQEKAIFEHEDWFVMNNEYRAKDREGVTPELQFLFVRIDHDDDLEPLSPNDYKAIGRLLQKCKMQYGFDGGCFFFRDGDPDLCGRTVRHPHAHYYIPRRVKDKNAPGGFRTIPIDIQAG